MKSIDRGVTGFLQEAQDTVRRQYEEVQESVRESPAASLAAAVAVGYFLHRLPLRSIINAKLRIISALAPPALFLFGAAKVYELLKEESEAARLKREYGFTAPPSPAPHYVD
jgi:hypothetical protein